MKKITLLASLLLAANAYAYELPNYKHVKGAVTHGKKVRIAIDFSKCNASVPEMNHPYFDFGVYTPNEMIMKHDGGIASSMNHFTLSDVNFKDTPVNQFVTYTVNPDDNVVVTGTVLDAINKTPLTKKHTFVCKMTEGAHIYAA